MIEINEKRNKPKEITLKAFETSWKNFFEVIHDLKDPIRRNSGESLGNFWALIDSLEDQYREKIQELNNNKIWDEEIARGKEYEKELEKMNDSKEKIDHFELY